jgi:hypothetical protein
MITNHWGKWVDNEEPVTGVISNNNIAWEWIEDECLTCQETWKEIDDNPDLDPDEKQFELDSCECDSSHTKIFGDWILDTKTDQYEPDTNGEFAAIEREDVTQIVWSKYTKRGALCSPCYPGQVDLDSDGQYLGYILPDELINHV